MSELLKINVNEHTEKKGNLTYLSWAWAWAEVLKHDPAALWCAHTYGPQGSEQPCMWIGETAMVHTSVTIKGQRRDCMLPVMDNKNNAIKSPDARKISDAIMRCMTKAIAMHGLGLYIYAGEDLPEESDAEPEKNKNGTSKGIGVHSAPKAAYESLSPDWRAWVDDFAILITNKCEQAGPEAAKQLMDEAKIEQDLQAEHIAGIWYKLDSKIRSQIKAVAEKAAK